MAIFLFSGVEVMVVLIRSRSLVVDSSVGLGEIVCSVWTIVVRVFVDAAVFDGLRRLITVRSIYSSKDDT